ncbi:unnamed protein product, partial [Arabidopsis lyrata]
NTSIN